MLNDSGLCNLFVYGTLRPGGALYDSWLSPIVTSYVDNVSTSGRLYHLRPEYVTYPVAKLDQPGSIQGTLLKCEVGERLQQTIAMEEGAGYVLWHRMIYVRGNDEVTALTFHYAREPEGPRIESGDWFTEAPRMNVPLAESERF